MYARRAMSFLHFRRLFFFSLTSYPGEIAYFNLPNEELSNGVGMSKIGYFFWHFMLLALLLLSLNNAQNYALRWKMPKMLNVLVIMTVIYCTLTVDIVMSHDSFCNSFQNRNHKKENTV